MSQDCVKTDEKVRDAKRAPVLFVHKIREFVQESSEETMTDVATPSGAFGQGDWRSGERRQQEEAGAPTSTSELLPDAVAELAVKYNELYKMTADARDANASLQRQVADLKKFLRAEVGKQMRLKQGYVQMQASFIFRWRFFRSAGHVV